MQLMNMETRLIRDLHDSIKVGLIETRIPYSLQKLYGILVSKYAIFEIIK